MAALTIRHDGLIASGQTIVGTGRAGSVGVYIPPGLDLVILDGLTVKGFDIGILAESPVVVVNSEFLDYQTAGVALTAGENYVEFCSFLDQRADKAVGACVIAGRGAAEVSVANNVFYVVGVNRHFGLGYRVAWRSKNNIGLASNVFGRTGNGQVWSPRDVALTTLDGVVEASPGFARTEPGAEILLLLHSSAAIRASRTTFLPAVDNARFDANTRMPRVDRRSNKRAVEFLSAGAHEMSFAITQDAKVRMLELIAGVSRVPFTAAASGRDGVFSRLPNTNANPTPVLVDDARDIQPSTDMAVMSFDDRLFGPMSAYFKPERLARVPFLLSAAPSRKSDMGGAGALTVMIWAKALSANADTLVWRAGEGKAQDQEVFAVKQRFQGTIGPNLRLKLSIDKAASDYAFVVEDATAISAIESAIAADAWTFSGWTFDGVRARFLFGRAGDPFLRAYPARPYVFDALTEQMVPAQGATALTRPRTVVDPNDSPICVGSDGQRRNGWHGFIADVRVDIGEALDRGTIEAAFLSGKQFDDRVRLTKQILQTDLLIGREKSLLIRVPGTPAGPYPGTENVFAAIKKVVLRGDDIVLSGRMAGGDREGVYLIQGRDVSTIVDNIPEVRDIAIDRAGLLVIIASDIPVSRLDFDEGERRTLVLDDAPLYGFRSVAVAMNGQYVVGDFSDLGGRLVLVDAPEDIASTAAAPTEAIPLGSVTIAKPSSIAITEDDEIFIVDDVGPAIVKVETWKLFESQMGVGVDAPIPAASTLVVPGADFARLGVLPGDRLAFVTVDEDIKTAAGQVVASLGSDLSPDNAGEFFIASVNGDSVTLDRPMVAESPASGRQFEARLYRRNASATVMHRGSPLASPSCVAFNPGDPSRSILVADPGAVRSGADPNLGVIFALTREGVLEPAHYRANLGFDLSTVTSVAFHPNSRLAPITVAGSLRSRLTWHMEIDPSARGTIKNAAFPGLSDLVAPRASLNELLLIQDADVRVEADRDDAVLQFEAVFGTDPRLERSWLNNEYENLSELGVMTKDGVVLLGRQAIVKTPYDPLSPVLTLWRQGVRISS